MCVGVQNDINNVRQQLATVQDDNRFLNDEIWMVDYWIIREYDEWSDDAKEKYGFEDKKDVKLLRRKKNEIMNEKQYFLDKERYLQTKGRLLLGKKNILFKELPKLIPTSGTKQAYEPLDVKKEEIKRRGKDFVESIIGQQSLRVIEEQQLYYMKDVTMLDGEILISLFHTVSVIFGPGVLNSPQGTFVFALLEALELVRALPWCT
jgi:hypothetical protein